MRITFICMGAENLSTETLSAVLKKAGCIRLQLGIQSVNQETRRKFLNL